MLVVKPGIPYLITITLVLRRKLTVTVKMKYHLKKNPSDLYATTRYLYRT